MTYTIVTLTLVGLILFFWLYKLMCNCFCRSFCIWKDQKNGSIITKEATILSVNTIKQGKKPMLELLLLFENLSGHPIHRKIRVWDSKPHLKRFSVDGKIPIGLTLAKKPKDPVFLSLDECRISFTFLLVCSLKVIVYVIGCYLFMGEAAKRIFASPEVYEHLFANSEIWQMGLIFLGVIIFLYFLLQKIGLMATGATKTQHWELLYQGFGTLATINSYKDTGTMINDNPVVGFNYSFVDKTGKTITGSDKKVVGKLEVGTLPDLQKMEVMYLPDNPSVSRFLENLEAEDMSKFIGFLFLTVLFIFSAVIVFSFYKSVF